MAIFSLPYVGDDSSIVKLIRDVQSNEWCLKFATTIKFVYSETAAKFETKSHNLNYILIG